MICPRNRLVHKVIHRRWGPKIWALIYYTHYPKERWIAVDSHPECDLLFLGFLARLRDGRLGSLKHGRGKFLEAVERGLRLCRLNVRVLHGFT